MGPQTLIKELEKLDFEYQLEDVLAEIKDENMAQLRTADLPDPGPEVPLGEDGRVPIEILGDLERIILPDNNLLPVHFLEEGSIKQRSVARIAWKQSGNGWGPGGSSAAT
ncbi:MAG TPA: hypothetical protein VLG28_12255 [Acidimicrobiia bacterium]|nr:hypothetical protein [Acidimicrobiia bacterium]